MNLQTRPREQPEINLTSLIDVVLLLLVFFMVSTSFVREAELRIDLPQASLTASESDTPSLEVAITVDGTYRVNGRELINKEPETLRMALRKVAGDQREIPVTIRADARTTHQSVVTAMDIAGQLGFVQINLVTVQDSN